MDRGAHVCDAALLCDTAALQALFTHLIDEMKLHPVGDAQWHQFPEAGSTGLALLQESSYRLPHFPSIAHCV